MFVLGTFLQRPERYLNLLPDQMLLVGFKVLGHFPCLDGGNLLNLLDICIAVSYFWSL